MRPLGFAAALGLTLAFGTTTLYAQDWQMPPDNQRCPSKWGADDQRGAGNMQTPASVLAALKLAKTGEIFELGAILSPTRKESFINEGRQFNIFTKVSPPVPNQRQIQEELVVTELGQIGTRSTPLPTRCGATVSITATSSATSARETGSRSSASSTSARW